jgi:hypothetical protein
MFFYASAIESFENLKLRDYVKPDNPYANYQTVIHLNPITLMLKQEMPTEALHLPWKNKIHWSV